MPVRLAADLSRRYVFDASTTVWVGTEPTLEHREVLDAPVYTHGVVRYALDYDNANALWRAAERMIGAALPLNGN
jgi:hypothetical protein